MDALQRFQDLLRTLFQFDCQELDFGIYRILNLRREQIERFITQRLPQIVDEAFQSLHADEQAQLEQTLQQQRAQLEQMLGKDAFENGQLKLQFRELPLAKAYAEALQRKQAAQTHENLKIQVYNDLYNFFSRYYEDGDFIAKRRYNQTQSPYLLPYHGEEVLLYWATRDQYYIKTGERFKNYRAKLGDYTLEFALREAHTEQNNLKAAEKRYFMPAAPDNLADSVEWRPESKRLTLYFAYRPLTPDEQAQFGSRENQRPQEQINQHYAPLLAEAARACTADPTLHALLQQDNALYQHLTLFTRRHTTDYFIHKNLRAFLQHELDLYLKTHCLQLDELLHNESMLRQNLQRARVVRQIAEQIIEFLHQIESFQKRLFEKKKFVIETHFVATLDRIPPDLWSLVFDNDAQQAEWQALGFTERPLTQNDLDQATDQPTLDDADAPPLHPRYQYLPVDTRHFDQAFLWRLLQHWENLEDQISGVLLHSENFQALRLLHNRYREQVKCIYIDPPYNTGSDGFLYKDAYRHSSWLSMMADRSILAFSLVGSNGSFWLNLDENEVHNFVILMRQIRDEGVHIGSIAWKKTSGDNKTIFSFVHDNLLVFAQSENALQRAPLSAEQLRMYSNPDNDPRGPWAESDYRSKWTKDERPNLYYPIIHPKTGEEIYPDTYSDSPRVWAYSREQHEKNVRENLVWWGLDSNSKEPRKKRFLKDNPGVNIRSVWDDAGSNDDASASLRDLFQIGRPFSNPKPIRLIEKILCYATKQDGIVLDFFAGSGTTGHAVLNLNRRDGGRRKFILVEQERYFDTVLLPRLKKVLFSDRWRDGKPEADGQGMSGLLMYHRLEQYEDTLNNLELVRAAAGAQAQMEFGDEYLLRYMLAFETEGSAPLMNPERFSRPLDYRLRVFDGDAQVERCVDLLWTFNYLLGLKVLRLQRFMNGDTEYRAVVGERGGKRLAVIWRNAQADTAWLQRDKAFVEGTVLPGLGAVDRVYLNSPQCVAGGRAIEPLFRRLMWGAGDAQG